MRAKLLAVMFLFALLTSVGCAKQIIKTSALPPGKRTQAAIVLENRIKRFAEETSRIRALAWFLIGDGNEERQTDLALVVERPDRARADALDPLADVWAKAATDGRQMWLFIPAKSKLYSGRASKGNLYRLTKFDFEMPELVALLAGGPPIPKDAQLLEAAKERPAHFYVQDSNLHIWADAKNHRIEKIVRFGSDSSNIDYTVEFSEYRQIGGVDFPGRVELHFPGRGARMVVVYKEVAFGGESTPTAFEPPSSGREKVYKLDKP